MNSDYIIDFTELIRDLNSDEILTLAFLENTDRLSSITIKDIVNSELSVQVNGKYSKIYFILGRLKIIGAVGIIPVGHNHGYYIKDNGKKILKYLSEN